MRRVFNLWRLCAQSLWGYDDSGEQSGQSERCSQHEDPDEVVCCWGCPGPGGTPLAGNTSCNWRSDWKSRDDGAGVSLSVSLPDCRIGTTGGAGVALPTPAPAE